jgi:hypothetical protein
MYIRNSDKGGSMQLDLDDQAVREGLISSMVEGGMKTLHCCYDEPFFYAMGEDGRWYRFSDLGMAAELYFGLKDDLPALDEPGILDDLVNAMKTAAAGHFELKRDLTWQVY